jgi:hypothetical protein
MTAQRIYIVRDKANGIPRLVQATSQAQAMRHVAEDRLSVEVASAMDVARYMGSGIKFEHAGEKPAEKVEE